MTTDDQTSAPCEFRETTMPAPPPAVPDFKRNAASRNAVRRAMLDIAVAGGEEPEGAFLSPLAAIRATTLIEDEARAELAANVQFAREAGHTWAEVGHALGYTGPGAAEDAYRAIALIPERLLGWICPACGQHIRDRGPGMPPADAEPGHADKCTRLAVATAAWEAAR